MVTNTRALAVYQLLFFVFMITMNALANALPLNGYNTGEISALYPNLFVPAGFTFSIWGVIYLLLLGYTVYSTSLLWKKNESNLLLKPVTYVANYFTLTCALNGTWILMWHFLQIELSLLFMLGLLVTLLLIYVKLKAHRIQLKGLKYLFLYVPFIVYIGWISVATIANTTALLVHYKWSGIGISEEAWSCIMICIATLLSVYFSVSQKSFIYSAVIAWALYGISVSQSSSMAIILFAYAGIALSVVTALAGVFTMRKARSFKQPDQ
jgi:hypothetical protein